MTRCPGCFKEGRGDAFCGRCRGLLFDGKKVPRVLPFSRPAYDDAKLKVLKSVLQYQLDEDGDRWIFRYDYLRHADEPPNPQRR